MATSRKTPPRKKRGPAKPKDKVIEAEVVEDAPVEDVVLDEPVPETAPGGDAQAEADSAVAEGVVETKPAAEPAQKPGFWGPVFGGLVAAAIGFGAAFVFFPDGWPWADKDVEIKAQLAAQADQLKEHGTEIDGIGTNLTELTGRSEANGGAIATAQSGIADLTARFDALSDEGAEVLPENLQILLNAQRAEIAALQGQVEGMAEDAKARIAAAADQQETAEQAEARVKARAAMSRLRLALTDGSPFAEALDDIAPATEIPAELLAVAQKGAPSLGSLQGEFPAAARAALSASMRETAGDAPTEKAKLFFSDLLGKRSLTPQEGDDPDAVLSRAEAAVKADNLAGALVEIEALPETGKAAFAEWSAQAQARIGAVSGFEAVAAALNGN